MVIVPQYAKNFQIEIISLPPLKLAGLKMAPIPSFGQRIISRLKETAHHTQIGLRIASPMVRVLALAVIGQTLINMGNALLPSFTGGPI